MQIQSYSDEARNANEMLVRVRSERDAAEGAEARLKTVAAEAHTIAEALQQSKIKVFVCVCMCVCVCLCVHMYIYIYIYIYIYTYTYTSKRVTDHIYRYIHTYIHRWSQSSVKGSQNFRTK
jgi:hypothetical protein